MGIRRLSFKLIAAIAIPLVVGLMAYALLLRGQVEDRLIGDVMRYFLSARAEELARELDRSLEHGSIDARTLARDPRCREILRAYGVAPREVWSGLEGELSASFEAQLRDRGVYSFAALVHVSGRILASAAGTRDDGRARAALARSARCNAAFEPWFRAALELAPADLGAQGAEWISGVARLDRRREPLLLEEERARRELGAIFLASVPRAPGGTWMCAIEGAIPRDGDAPELERWWRGIAPPPPGLEELLEDLARSAAPEAAVAVSAGLAQGTDWRLRCAVALDAAGNAVGAPWQASRPGEPRAPALSGRSWAAELGLADASPRERRELGVASFVRAAPAFGGALPELSHSLASTRDLRDYVVCFSVPVRLADDPQEAPAGVLVLAMAWAHVQEDVLDRVGEEFELLHEGERYESGYAFLFAADGDTIIGHRPADAVDGRSDALPPVRPNYDTRLTRDHDLRSLHERVTAADGGFASYEYPPGNPKHSGFRRTASKERGGFGWIAGVGIDDRDTRGTVRFLGNLLLGGAILLAVWSVLSIVLVSRAMTRPIRNLILFTNRLADGDLSARVPIRGNDELGRLGRAFNAMADALGRARERLVAAEKEAAWREMARQIAHEIKNPLTPMRLSAQLLPRAFHEKPEQFPEILERSVETILRSIDSLRGIAADFARFAGAPSRRPERLRCGEIIDQVLELFRGMSEDGRVRLERRGLDGEVIADREELRRVFLNLVDNAFQALLGAQRESGCIAIEMAEGEAGFWRIAIRDDGPGIPPEAQPRLFEPYFSTKTTGTGLGLAICRRIAREMGGELELGSTGPEGTTLVLRVPRASDDASAGSDASSHSRSAP
ncbi:MAG: HAMP domain-containing protein [Planctomycetes bacterium]|nr:HAMP domain-containing protein [Planctomycetota bacterium]